ncbi:MAG: hypothetical protein BAJATHORv1_30444 [Candidatus Thorarchaeota archaeon]|nr:MAG: hypothetical protein BAJATHORv1_30444 [Candidatus Thorarchaeota archaeon]
MKHNPISEDESNIPHESNLDCLEIRKLYVEYLHRLEVELSKPNPDLTELGITNSRCMRICKRA